MDLDEIGFHDEKWTDPEYTVASLCEYLLTYLLTNLLTYLLTFLLTY